MIAWLLSLATIFAWGLWLAPSQRVPFASERVRSFYVAFANLILAAGVVWCQGGEIPSGSDFWASFGAGIFWIVGSWAAFGATQRIGLARAMGVWAPLNILTACLLGVLLFGEFLDLEWTGTLSVMFAWVFIGAGVALVVLSGRFEVLDAAASQLRGGLIYAILAGVLWGSYFIPLQLSGLSLAEAVFPMSLGIFSGSILGILKNPRVLRLEAPSHYARAMTSGLLWGVGNYSSLALMAVVGTGRGFTIAQLCIVVNALVGIYWFRDPEPKGPAARKVIIGAVLAVVGGVLLGSVK